MNEEELLTEYEFDVRLWLKAETYEIAQGELRLILEGLWRKNHISDYDDSQSSTPTANKEKNDA